MTDRNDVELRLRDLAAEPAPLPDPTFADDLDVRLRVLHAGRLGATRSRPLWKPVLLGSMAIIVLAAAAALVLNLTSKPAVILTAASNTDIILPGDRAAAATVGLHLPDGTRIVVGDDGEAVVNGVVLGPGSEALVVGDQIDVVVTMVDAGDRGLAVDDSEAMVVESPPTTASDDGSPDAARPAVTDADREPDPIETNRQTTTVTAREQPSSTSATATMATTSTSPPPSTSSSTARSTTTTVRDQRPAPLELTVERVGRDRLRLDWTLNWDITPAGWRVRVRHGDRVATVVAIRDGAARMTTIELTVAAGGSVWIEALDDEGRVLLATEPVEIPIR